MYSSQEVHFDGKIAQKAIIVRGLEVLLMRDPREPEDIWELPGGRMNEGEEPREALSRELYEELGVDFEVHEIVHLQQFFQKSEKRNAFVIVYRATLVDEKAEFFLAKDEVAELRWFNKSEVGQLKLFPEYEKALKVFFNM